MKDIFVLTVYLIVAAAHAYAAHYYLSIQRPLMGLWWAILTALWCHTASLRWDIWRMRRYLKRREHEGS